MSAPDCAACDAAREPSPHHNATCEFFVPSWSRTAPEPDLAARRAAWLAEGIKLGVCVLDSQDEFGRPTFGPANALVTLESCWVQDGHVNRPGRTVLVLAYDRSR